MVYPRAVGKILCCLVLLAAAGNLSCSIEDWLNFTADLGGDAPRDRGTYNMVFVNNTPHRAIFAAGSFDQFDQLAEVQFAQFGGLEASLLTLEGNSTSDVIPFNCAKLISVGGQRLIDLIIEQGSEDSLDPSVLERGVKFSSVPLGEEGSDEATEGMAQPLDIRLGTEWECGSVIIFRFEFDDVGPDPFRVDFDVLQPGEENQ